MAINKNTYLISILFLLLVVSPVIASTCSVNGKEIPCELFWPKFGWIISVPFILAGLISLIKPDWIVKWYSLFGLKFFGPVIIRVVGALFLVIGLIFLYRAIFP